jgi:hypothetical protein
MKRSERQATEVLIVFLLLLLAFGILVFIYGENQHAKQHGLTTPAQTKFSDGFRARG